MKKVAGFANGNGGGSPTFAQGGASKIEDYHQILDFVIDEIANME